MGRNDEKKKIFIETKNRAESTIHSVEKNIKNLESKVPKEEKDLVLNKIIELKKFIQLENVDSINNCLNELNKLSMKISQYKNNQKTNKDNQKKTDENHPKK